VPVEPTAAAPPTTGSVPPLFGKHKRKKGAVANSDSHTRPTTTTSDGVTTTGIQPSCDANGDGFVDPGADPACAGPGTTTGVSTTESAPAQVAPEQIEPRKKKAASKKKKKARASKLKRRRASAR
jgi:hypothetical protein